MITVTPGYTGSAAASHKHHPRTKSGTAQTASRPAWVDPVLQARGRGERRRGTEGSCKIWEMRRGGSNQGHSSDVRAGI